MTGFGSGLTWVAACVAAVGMLSASANAADPRENAAFPRIARVNGVVLEPGSDGGKGLAGEALTLEEIARYDLILGIYGPWEDEANWPVLRTKLARLREANPGIVIIGRTVQVETAYADAASVPAGMSWHKPPDGGWLVDVEGKRLPGSVAGTFFLNLRQQSVLDWLMQRCVEDVTECGFDGVLLGAMGPDFPDWTLTRTVPGYTVDADGDAVADELTDLRYLWEDAKKQLCANVRTALGDDAVIVAGGTPQSDFILELFNGWTTGTPLLELKRGNANWIYEHERCVAWTTAPHTPHTTLWASVPDPAAPPESAANLAQRMRFGLTATLMADGYFAFVAEGKQERWFPEFDAPLRRPLKQAIAGPAADVWLREFEGGIVVVNPTTEPGSVEFETAHRDFSTGAVAKAFAIPAKDGRILVPAAEAGVPARPAG